jgi:hypothetical protein
MCLQRGGINRIRWPPLSTICSEMRTGRSWQLYTRADERKGARMPGEPTSSDAAAAGDPEGAQSNGSKTAYNKTAIAVAAVGAIGVIVAAAVTGVFGLLDKPSTGASSSGGQRGQACSGFAADVQIPSSVGSNPTLTFQFNCTPPAGYKYLWVIEAVDIGKDHHTEYYPKEFSSTPSINTPLSYPLDLSKDKIGERNCILVISSTIAQYRNILNNLNDRNFTLQLPDSIATVSKPACEQREY